MRSVLVLFLTLFIFPLIVFAQEIADHPAACFVDSSGQVYTKTNAPAYFFIAPADNPEQLVAVPSSDKAANPMAWDGNGNHFIVHRDLMRNMDIRFKVIADGIPPRTKIAFQNGLVFYINENYFAEIGGEAILSASDDMTGVNETFVSVDGMPYKPFSGVIEFPEEKEYTLQFYSVDNVGNVEQPRKIKVFTTLEAVVQMDNIYFDLNSSKLKPEAMGELNKMVKLLKGFPDVMLEIRAHSDSRGNAEFNLMLSEQRAQSAVDYIIAKGISKDRLKAKGYGDKMLVNECAKDVRCPEEKHKENRRVEFFVSRLN